MSDLKLCKIYLILNSCICAIYLTSLALNIDLNPIYYCIIFSICMFSILYVNYPNENYHDMLLTEIQIDKENTIVSSKV